MTVTVDLITGVSVGIEYIPALPEEEIDSTILIDIFIVRFLFQW